MIAIENADCTAGIIYFPKEDGLTNMEMLMSAPFGAAKHLDYGIYHNQWVLTWKLRDVEVYRADARERVNNAKPVPVILEIEGS